MKRREFITLLGGAARVAARSARAAGWEAAAIGYLGSSTALHQSLWVAAFVQRLSQLGWIEHRNIAIDYRWAEARTERFAEIAAEFVRLNVNVIVTAGTAPVLAAKRATSVIPIVFATAGDPVGTGLVASLARPGGQHYRPVKPADNDLFGEQLELLREGVPGLRRLAIIANVDAPASVLEMRDVQAMARTLGLEVAKLEVRRPEDIASAFETLMGRADALYVVIDPLLSNNRVRINTLAQGTRLPTMHGYRDLVEAGGLMSYGPNFPDLFRRTADYVDKILRGAKPGDLPVEQPTKFDLVVNVTTAKALGLIFPPSLLGRADEVIECIAHPRYQRGPSVPRWECRRVWNAI